MDTIFALLEEVDELLARIELSTTELPYAHFAHHQAALARQALETELIRQEHAPTNVSNILPLKILRTIARTTMPITAITAVMTGDVGGLWLALESGEFIDDNNCSYYACRTGQTEIVRFLLNKGFCANAFQIACKFGQTELVRMLLDLEINPATRYNEALHISSYNGYTDIVRLLLDLPLERGVDPAELNHALTLACKKRHKQVVRLLLDLPLERGVNPNASFRIACIYDHVEIVRLFLELPLERGVELSDGLTYVRKTEIVRLLLESGRCTNLDKNNLLFTACYNGNTETVRLLLELPLERCVIPSTDNRAFRQACRYGYTEIVRLLLDLPPEIGVNPAADDNVALRDACDYGHTEIVRLLLDLPPERGVNPTIFNNDALRLATLKGHTVIKQLLKAKIPWYCRLDYLW